MCVQLLSIERHRNLKSGFPHLCLYCACYRLIITWTQNVLPFTRSSLEGGGLYTQLAASLSKLWSMGQVPFHWLSRQPSAVEAPRLQSCFAKIKSQIQYESSFEGSPAESDCSFRRIVEMIQTSGNDIDVGKNNFKRFKV